jgi:large subunit ribosomal protein L13e
MVKHNNVLPNAHFHKDWQRRVRTWFDQPAQKKVRRLRREKKAKAIFPRPVSGALRPAIRPPTKKYNSKLRLGRGFTLEELKKAGINHHFAKTIGIAVDYRRRNRSEASLAVNAQRLKEYQSKLVLFPRNSKKPKTGDATAETLKEVRQATGTLLPIKKVTTKATFRAITEEEKKTSAFWQLRKARADARLVGIRNKKAKAKEDAQK